MVWNNLQVTGNYFKEMEAEWPSSSNACHLAGVAWIKVGSILTTRGRLPGPVFPVEKFLKHPRHYSL